MPCFSWVLPIDHFFSEGFARGSLLICGFNSVLTLIVQCWTWYQAALYTNCISLGITAAYCQFHNSFLLHNGWYICTCIYYNIHIRLIGHGWCQVSSNTAIDPHHHLLSRTWRWNAGLWCLLTSASECWFNIDIWWLIGVGMTWLFYVFLSPFTSYRMSTTRPLASRGPHID